MTIEKARAILDKLRYLESDKFSEGYYKGYRAAVMNVLEKEATRMDRYWRERRREQRIYYDCWLAINILLYAAALLIGGTVLLE